MPPKKVTKTAANQGPSGSSSSSSSSSSGSHKGADDEKSTHTRVEAMGFPLKSYIEKYKGPLVASRLTLIASLSPDIAKEALTMAVEHLKTGINAFTYSEVLMNAQRFLSEEALAQPDFKQDQGFLNSCHRHSSDRMTRLEQTLDIARRDEDSDMTRHNLTLMAHLLTERGEYKAALDKFLEVKEVGFTSNIQLLTNSLDILRASVYNGFIRGVEQLKICSRSPELKSIPLLRSKLTAAAGLQMLGEGNFQAAADYFLQVESEMGSSFNEIVTIEDIATYASVCALATFDRVALQRVSHSKLLEASPVWADVIQAFLGCKFEKSFSMMEELRAPLQLDYFLSSKINGIYQKIQDRALVQYFQAFSSIRLPNMGKVFGLDVEALESRLASLIGDNKLQGRIDSHNKTLISRETDERRRTYEKALITGQNHVDKLQSILCRMSLVREGLIVKQPFQRPSQNKGSGTSMLGLYEQFATKE